jgi:hypothetical protein
MTADRSEFGQTQIVLTIGRNVGDTPLPHADWVAYRDGIARILGEFVEAAPYGGFVTVNGNIGQGAYEGVPEDNCVFVALLNNPSVDEIAEDDIPGLVQRQAFRSYIFEHDLAHFAHGFGQETVAFTYGPNVLLLAHEDQTPQFEATDDALTALLDEETLKGWED